MRNLLILLTSCFLGMVVSAQTILQSAGAVSECSGFYYDSGGSAGAYAANENFQLTICPNIPGNLVSLNFTMFEVEPSWDLLTIYNGSSTAGASIGVYSGGVSPGYIQSSALDGCLTIVFTSDATTQLAGWVAEVECSPPCQQVVASASTNPAPTPTFVDVCIGENITFSGSGVYPENGTSYIQSDITSSYSWNFGDNSTSNVQNPVYSYSTGGIYQVDLSVIDNNGCFSTNDVDILVRVAAEPTFTGSVATNQVICLGESNTLTGAVTPTEIVLDCSPSSPGVTALPDGSGVSYANSVSIDCYSPGQTVTQASDILDICLDIEHSYAGDLDIAIQCPNGTIVELVDYATSGLGLQLVGEPVDNTSGDVGTGFTYCFDDVSPQSWADFSTGAPSVTYTDNAGTVVTAAQIPAGSYSSAELISGLIGCPLNGDWSILVTDNIFSDDGYIFSWSVNFDPSLTPATLTDIPAVVSESWQADPTVTATAGNTITVVPTVAGPACYSYTMTDEFGCNYDTTICFTVLPPNDPACPSCFMSNYEVYAAVVGCDPYWTMNGVVEFSDAPTTGDLVFEDCDGNITVIASAPFTSPVNYGPFPGPLSSISGGNCAFQVYFTDEVLCQNTLTMNLAGVAPPEEAGTVSENMLGNGLNNFILCDQDVLEVTSNDDWDIQSTNPANNPGLVYLVYNCPPSPGGIGINPGADPCFVTYFSTEDIAILNNGGVNDGLIQLLSTPANNQFYLVPFTAVNVDPGSGAITFTQDCYDLAIEEMITVQYLNPIENNIVEDCQAGTATVTINGGYPEFYGGTYTISNVLPATATALPLSVAHNGNVVISGLTDGDNYSFDVTDANGCPVSISGTFTGIEDASFTYPSTTYCADATDPVPTVTGVAGGTYSSTAGISLNPGTGSVDLSASTPGTYTITYQSPNPVCFGTETFTITINPLPVITVVNTGPICQGEDVSLDAGGASTYFWNNGLGAGESHTTTPGPTSYTVTGTDVNGCVNTAVTNVVINPLPVVSAGPDQTLCEGPNVTLTGSGADSYVWDNGVVDGTAFTPVTGTTTYTVTGTDANGCVNTDQVDVTVNPLPTIVAPADFSVCVGGTVTLNGAGGDTYVWDNGVTNGTPFSPPATNTYTVTGTDANGCVNTDQVTVSVLANAPIDAGVDQTVCEGVDVTLNASGGVTYVWDNGVTDGVAFTPALGTTTYTVNGTDVNGCTGTDQVNVTVNPLPVINAGADQTVCIGSDVTLSGAGGVSYVWDNGITDGVAFTPVAGTTTYTVTGTDVNGCVNTDQVDVIVNDLPVINAGVDQEECFGTMITLTGSGAPTLNWDNGVNDGVAFNQAAGTTTYTVTGTDANGCVNTDQVDVVINALPIVDAGVDQSECDGTMITLSGSGADSYVWDNGVTDGVAFNQAIGTVVYTVNGTDVNGCENTDQVSVTVNPNPTPVINGAIEYCAGTNAALDAGAGFDSYLWSNGAVNQVENFTEADNPISVTVSFATGCSGTSAPFTVTETSQVTTNYSFEICEGESMLIHGNNETTSGTYVFTGISSTGCDSIANITLTVNPLPVVNAGTDVAVCEGVDVTLTASGAVNYAWDNGVVNGVTFTQAVGTITYTVTGTDAEGCSNTDQVDVTINPTPNINAGADVELCDGAQATLSGSNGATYDWNNGITDGVAFTPIATNTYTVTGTDANGCVNTDQVDVIVNPLPVIDAGADQTVCEGVQTTVNGSGGTSYDWDNGIFDGVAFTQVNGTITYTVTGTDANGCVNTDNVDITVNALPTVDAGLDQTVCEGLDVTLNGSGANTYVWDNGVVNNVSFTSPTGTTTYTVTGTDINGCENTDQVDVTVNLNPVIDAGPDQEECEGVQVTLAAQGVGAGGSYVWNNGVIDGVAFDSPLGTVTYTVTGTDVNGCTDSDEVDVVINPNPTVFAGNDITICENENVILTGSGANSYVWNNGGVDGVAFIPASTNTYTVTGTTLDGCEGTDDVLITIEPVASPNFNGDVLFGCAPLDVTFTPTAIDPGMSCEWYFSDGTTSTGCDPTLHTFDTPGCYDVTYEVTSVNGCVSSVTYSDYICVDNDPVAAFTATPEQASITNTEIDFTNNSTGATSYVWSFGDNSPGSSEVNPSHTYPSEAADSYTVVLEALSVAGCVDTAVLVVDIVEELIFYVPNTFTPDLDNYNPTFQPVFTSGFDPYDYQLLIFNRWGEVIFESNNAEIGWDGTYGEEGSIVRDGTYIWTIEFKTTMNDERIKKVGHVNLFR